MTESYANLATSSLVFDIGVDDDTLTVQDGDDFPLAGDFRIVIHDEIIIGGDRSGDTVTDLTRGAEGTTAATHAAGSPVVHVLTAGGLQAIIADQLAGVAISGAGAPEGVVTAAPTTLFRDTAHNELYLKAGGTGNTGWVLMEHPESTAHAGFAGLTFPANDHPQYVQDVMANFKGDMVVGTGDNTVTRLGVGANGTHLTADSTKAEGMAWA